MARFCIAGLGNPGPRYQGTRHNIGFEWIDAAVAQILGPKERAKFSEKFESLWLSLSFDGHEIHFLKPQTFMNESGRALLAWKEKYQGDSKFLVAFDDLDLPLGKLRYREKGSDGGHRGLRSCIERLQTNEIPRLRLGIGRPNEETIDYVLSRFNPEDKEIVAKMCDEASLHLKIFLNESGEKIMNQINSKFYGIKKEEGESHGS